MRKLLVLVLFFAAAISAWSVGERYIKTDKLIVGLNTAGVVSIEADQGGVNNPALRFNNTENKWEKSDDGIDFGSFGGGVGSAAIFKLVNADDDGIAFTGGWTTSGGTLSVITTGQLAGKKSYKFAPSAATDETCSPDIELPKRTLDLVGQSPILVDFAYDATDDGFEVHLEDQSNNKIGGAISVLSAKNRAQLFVNLQGTETHVSFCVTDAVHVASMELVFDDATFSDEPFRKTETIETGSIRLTGSPGFGSSGTRIRRFTNLREQTGDLIDYTPDAVNGDYFTIKRDGIYTLTWYDRASSNIVGIGFSVNAPDLTANIWALTSEYKRALEYIAISGGDSSSSTAWTGKLNKGDIVRAHGGNPGQFDNATEEYVGFAISGIAINDNVVVENADGSEWTSYTPTTNGIGGLTNIDFYWKRDGDSVLIMGDLDIGSAASAEFRIGLPTGLTIGAVATSRKVVGEVHRADLTPTETHYSLLADQGLSYLTMGYRSSGLNVFTTPQNGNAGFGAGDHLTFSARVPIEGWSATEAHIIPIADPYENVYSAHVDGSLGAGTVILSESKAGSFTVTRTAQGLYTVNYSSLGLSVSPSVVATVADSNSFNVSVTSISTTQATLNIRNTVSDGDTDRDFSIVIQRQGADYREPRGYFLGSMVAPRTWIDENTATGGRTSLIPWDNTKPQIGEGEEIASITFTPSTPKVEVDIQLHHWERTNASNGVVIGIFKDGAADAVGASVLSNMTDGTGNMGGGETRKFFISVTPNVQTTISFRAGSNTGGTWYLNEQDNGGSTLGGLVKSHLKITEIRE